jgi:hypothetical protein
MMRRTGRQVKSHKTLNIKYVIGAVLDWNMTSGASHGAMAGAVRRPTRSPPKRHRLRLRQRPEPMSQDCSKMPGNG